MCLVVLSCLFEAFDIVTQHLDLSTTGSLRLLQDKVHLSQKLDAAFAMSESNFAFRVNVALDGQHCH